MFFQWCRGEACRHPMVEEVGEVALSARGGRVDLSYLISGEATAAELKNPGAPGTMSSSTAETEKPTSTTSRKSCGSPENKVRGRGDISNASTCSASSEASFGELSSVSVNEDLAMLVAHEGACHRNDSARSQGGKNQEKFGGSLHLDLSKVMDSQRAPLTLLPSNPPQVRYRGSPPSNRYKDKNGRLTPTDRPSSRPGNLSRRSGSSVASTISPEELRRSVCAAERLLSASSRRGKPQRDCSSGARASSGSSSKRGNFGAVFHRGGSGEEEALESNSLGGPGCQRKHTAKMAPHADLSPIVESVNSNHEMSSSPVLL
eukprot:CAMPEP_0206495246 /NCGR_PEP_ID=MMETSP0324_2-20121206/48345_1 /ASSEMBLY_ACC=CAM_ASM_000836 /TAXON_ID=2866 /ORGANISM="Crypthecodinium cohnii, Strain Seligo" /LENGTH=317 /DNA_ID=CAMNT_0053979327 /DNA_START=681 /DNA_END=1634 /DNA_ORIENTATION=+